MLEKEMERGGHRIKNGYYYVSMFELGVTFEL